MANSPAIREKVYRAYMEFFEVAERKRRWSVFDDVPWDALESAQNDERKAVRIETFCAEEMYVPDYSSGGLTLTRSLFGTAWFQMCWSYEEAKHALVLREYLTRSGLRSAADLDLMEARVFATPWTLPFETYRQMACYGALQEMATYLAYRAQKQQAAAVGDRVLETIFALIGRDEAAHAGFYRTLIELEMAEDRAGTIADFGLVMARFKMPGDGLIPDYQARLHSSGAGISTRMFLEHGVLPTLKTLGTSRAEVRALQQGSRP